MCSGGNGGRNNLFIGRGWKTLVEEKAAMVQWIYGANCFVWRNPSPSVSSVNTRGPFYSAGYQQPRPLTQPTMATHHWGNKGKGDRPSSDLQHRQEEQGKQAGTGCICHRAKGLEGRPAPQRKQL